ncbi:MULTISPECIES: phage tail tube protein [unclassified Streptomyces]|uniref:phage tail tube protein n=1 Tax=unclassified Streptomyces TaxID=2593676 RepID=UPI00343FA285
MDLISDGKTRVAWASSLTNLNAPTVAECNAAQELTARITPDGLKIDPTTADVDTSSLASKFDTKEAGRVGYETELTFKRGTTLAEDWPYQNLKYGLHGVLIVRRGIDVETAWTAGQQVETYPLVCGERANVSPAANEVSKFISPIKVTAPPATDAVVAA